MAKPMGEPRYSCSICGKPGSERPASEMNYLYPVDTPTGTVWQNRCYACYRLFKEGKEVTDR